MSNTRGHAFNMKGGILKDIREAIFYTDSGTWLEATARGSVKYHRIAIVKCV